jgi:hypothetical protein
MEGAGTPAGACCTVGELHLEEGAQQGVEAVGQA